MRRVSPWHLANWAACGTALLLIGAGPGKKAPDLKNETPPKADETVGDLAFVRYNDTIRVEGVGLVVNLDGTGSDPVPGPRRAALLDRMRKAQVPNAEKWLESPNTSLVIVKGTIPVGVTTKDRWDIEVEVDPASTTKSLAGGVLLMTPLTVVQLIDGQDMKGQLIAEAYGPILTGSPAKPDDPRVGRVLGGARVKKDIPYALILKEKRQGFRTADLLQRVVNLRFFRGRATEQEGMAVAKTDQYLTLNVPKTYHHNQFRYFQVIERLPMIDTPELRTQRQERWGAELLDPRTAGQAALKLEGIGRNASEALKKGLTSPHPQVRFFAAEALAYLNDSAGADVLGEAAKDRPEFRAFALAALAALDQPASELHLRRLMDLPDPKVRYGAFDALRTLDEHNPSLGKVRVLHDPRDEAPSAEGDAMAIRTYAIPRKKPRLEDPFDLYVVDCDGPPMVHVARSRRREIVVFGRDQKLLTPVVLGGAGPILLNAAEADAAIEISRIGAGDPGLEDQRTTAPPVLAEVVTAMANLGASYPDVLAILQGADRQKNLQGPLVVDALPPAQPAYDAAQLAGVDATSGQPKTDAAVGQASAESKEPEPPARKRLGQRLRDRFRREDR
jgi:flagellar basal body P-ring protein FlgI